MLPASSAAHPHQAFRVWRAHGPQFHVGMDAAAVEAAGRRVLTAWARTLTPARPPGRTAGRVARRAGAGSQPASPA